MNKSISRTILICFTYLGIISSSIAGEHLIQPKLGFINWTDNGPHRVRSNTFTFDNDISTASGFKYAYRLDNGFAFGGELYGYEKDYTHSNGNRGSADIGHFYATAEYYFNNDGSIKPFIGGGLGWAGIDFSGAIKHDTSGGSSVEFNAGVEFSINKRFSITVEGKYFTLDIDDDYYNNEEADIKSDGYGTFVGFTIKI